MVNPDLYQRRTKQSSDSSGLADGGTVCSNPDLRAHPSVKGSTNAGVESVAGTLGNGTGQVSADGAAGTNARSIRDERTNGETRAGGGGSSRANSRVDNAARANGSGSEGAGAKGANGLETAVVTKMRE
jgi:hypothetical protein